MVKPEPVAVFLLLGLGEHVARHFLTFPQRLWARRQRAKLVLEVLPDRGSLRRKCVLFRLVSGLLRAPGCACRVTQGLATLLVCVCLALLLLDSPDRLPAPSVDAPRTAIDFVLTLADVRLDLEGRVLDGLSPVVWLRDTRDVLDDHVLTHAAPATNVLHLGEVSNLASLQGRKVLPQPNELALNVGLVALHEVAGDLVGDLPYAGTVTHDRTVAGAPVAVVDHALLVELLIRFADLAVADVARCSGGGSRGSHRQPI